MELEAAIEQVQRDLAQFRDACLKLAEKKPRYQQTVFLLQEAEQQTQELIQQVLKIGLENKDHIQKQELLQIIDSLLKKEEWTQNKFLQAMEQHLQTIHTELSHHFHMNGVAEPTKKEMEHLDLLKQRAGMISVFKLLYQSDGLNMKKWATLLHSIGGLSTSRPIYQKEEDVRSVIRFKEYPQNEGYAAVYVLADEIVSTAFPGQTEHDKQGRQLLFVKEGALKPKNIISFSHISGRYVLEDTHLIRQEDSNL